MFVHTNLARRVPPAVDEADQSMGELFEAAKLHVGAYSEELTKALCDTRALHQQALDAVYSVCAKIGNDQEAVATFCKTHGIEVDPRAKHAIQPIVKGLIGGKERDALLRSKVSVWSGAITVGLREGLSSSSFLEKVALAKGGLDGVYRDDVRATKGKAARLDRAQSLLAARKAYASAHPAVSVDCGTFSDPVVQGLHLLVIEMDENGAARIVTRLDNDSAAIDRMQDQFLLRWAVTQRMELADA